MSDISTERKITLDLNEAPSEPWEAAFAKVPAAKPRIQIPGKDRLIGAFAAELGQNLRHAQVYRKNEKIVVQKAGSTEFQEISPAKFVTWIEPFVECYKGREPRRQGGDQRNPLVALVSAGQPAPEQSPGVAESPGNESTAGDGLSAQRGVGVGLGARPLGSDGRLLLRLVPEGDRQRHRPVGEHGTVADRSRRRVTELHRDPDDQRPNGRDQPQNQNHAASVLRLV